MFWVFFLKTEKKNSLPESSGVDYSHQIQQMVLYYYKICYVIVFISKAKNTVEKSIFYELLMLYM